MEPLEDRFYRISEVAQITGVKAHVLRQWEDRFGPLKPDRDTSGRRIYSTSDIDIVFRLKQLMRHDKMTSKGAARRLTQELYGDGAPRTDREAKALIDKIEDEARDLLDLLGGFEEASPKNERP